MTDILLCTVECVRYDERQHCPAFDDFQTVEGVATGTYTRPSLAALLSGQFRAAAETAVRAPTLPGVLADAGYATAGFAHSPQTARPFGFGQGFDRYDTVAVDGGPLARGSALRERLATIGPVRRLYRRLKSKNATLAAVQPDHRTLADAREWWQATDGPRFLWVHLMGSHRPYGWDEDALPAAVGRRAANADTRLPAPAHEQVVEYYRAGLGRVGRQVELLLAKCDPDVAVVAGDHGEELGEQCYYFHAPHRQRLVDALVRVPVGVRGLDIEGRVGLVDLPAWVCGAAGVESPAGWDARRGRDWWLSAAPWSKRIKWRLHGDGVDLRLSGESVETAGERAVSEQLAALGYQ